MTEQEMQLWDNAEINLPLLNKLSEPNMCILPFIHMNPWPAGQV